VKFLRHFAVVLLVVAAIVGLGMLWAHASGSGAGLGPGPGPGPANGHLRVEQLKAGMMGPADTGFNFADTGNLIRTCEIEAALAAVVITITAVRRRHRRMRRT